MVSKLLRCILVIYIITLITLLHEADAITPVMKPLGRKLELEPGDPLEIICMSSKNIKFIQPRPKQFQEFKSTKSAERVFKMGPRSWIRTLTKARTTIADAGFYGCTNDDVKVDVNKHSQSNVAWIEVVIPNW